VVFNPPPPPGPPGQTWVPPGYAAYQAPPLRAAQFGQISTFGRRLGGLVLDSLIYGALSLPFVIGGVALVIASVADIGPCTTTAEGSTTCAGDWNPGMLAAGIVVGLLGYLFVYGFAIWQLHRTGQTFGRRIVGVKVIDEITGLPPSLGKAIGRTLFAHFISAQILYIGYLWMLWDDKRQTLHDKVAGTHVIDA
jgi:uncharacterized RDD family membrane protein YckC